MSKPYPPVHYSDYLKLEQLLSAQKLKSDEYGKHAHDEMLFIIVHQTYELWFKQILHELQSVAKMFENYVDEKNIGTAVARLHRITEIQKILIDQLRVLETMTPLDFLDFRDYLVPASGFQSLQFRLVENTLGLKRENRLDFDKQAYHTRLDKGEQKKAQAAEESPSLFDRVEKWLERTPFLEFEKFKFWDSYREAVNIMLSGDRAIITSNPSLTDTDKEKQFKQLDATGADFDALFDSKKHEQLIKEGHRRLSYKALQAALLISLYREEPILHMPYRLITTIVDIDELFTSWRYRHALMVHRMIGMKIGTGGSSGHQYLSATAAQHKIFADFMNLSTFMIPRSELPALPKDVVKNLGFYYSQK